MQILIWLSFLAIIATNYAFTNHLSSHSSSFTHNYRGMKLLMGGNKAKFGIFSPAVVAAKFVLGDAKLNKVE